MLACLSCALASLVRPAGRRRTSSCRPACRTNARGSAPPRKTSAARHCQHDAAAEFEPHFHARLNRTHCTDIDKWRNHFRLRTSLALLDSDAVVQHRPPAPEYAGVDPLRSAKLQHRHPARCMGRKDLPPRRLATLDPPDLIHRSLRFEKTGESLSGSGPKKKGRRRITGYDEPMRAAA